MHDSGLRARKAPRIRPATVADVSQIMAIRIAAMEDRLSDPNTVTAQLYRDYPDNLRHGWVCEDEGQIIGFSYPAREGFI